MTLVFFDTVGLVALWDEADQWHELANEAYGEIKASRTEIVTTSLVMLECGNAAARRPYRKAVNQWREVIARNKGANTNSKCNN